MQNLTQSSANRHLSDLEYLGVVNSSSDFGEIKSPLRKRFINVRDELFSLALRNEDGLMDFARRGSEDLRRHGKAISAWNKQLRPLKQCLKNCDTIFNAATVLGIRKGLDILINLAETEIPNSGLWRSRLEHIRKSYEKLATGILDTFEAMLKNVKMPKPTN